MTGTSSLRFHSIPQGAVSTNNVEFGVKQLKSQLGLIDIAGIVTGEHISIRGAPLSHMWVHSTYTD